MGEILIEGHLSQRRNSDSFQNNVWHLPVAEPDEREIKYCPKGIENTERISINGTCFQISSICEASSYTNQLVRKIKLRTNGKKGTIYFFII